MCYCGSVYSPQTSRSLLGKYRGENSLKLQKYSMCKHSSVLQISVIIVRDTQCNRQQFAKNRCRQALNHICIGLHINISVLSTSGQACQWGPVAIYSMHHINSSHVPQNYCWQSNPILNSEKVSQLKHLYKVFNNQGENECYDRVKGWFLQ